LTNGVRLQIGSAEYVVPPITCWAAKRVAIIARDAAKQSLSEDAWIDVLWEQIGVVLAGNYPDVSVEELQKSVPLRDLADLHSSVMKAAGAARGEPGEATSP
jgi:hypothetical protein